MTQVCNLLLLFSLFYFTVISGLPLRTGCIRMKTASYPPASVTKSTGKVNRMHVPNEAQQHGMLFDILKPRLQDDQSCQQNSFCVMCRFCVGSAICNTIFWPEVPFFSFGVLLPSVFRFFEANFCWVFLSFFLFFLSFIINGRLPF